MAGDDEEVLVNHVAIKLPTFWTKNPRSWFVSVEAQFQRAKITQEETRYWHVLAVLPCEVIDSIHSITENPGEQPYTALKNKLLGTYTPSAWKAIWHVFDMPNLATDQKPSTLLDNMVAGLPKEVKTDNPMLHALFLRKLPAFVRAPLMAVKFESIQQMASQADEIWGGQDEQVASNAISERSPRSPRRSSSKRPPRRADTPGRHKLCFYHHRFGKRANKCEPPCTWQESGNALAADDSD